MDASADASARHRRARHAVATVVVALGAGATAAAATPLPAPPAPTTPATAPPAPGATTGLVTGDLVPFGQGRLGAGATGAPPGADSPGAGSPRGGSPRGAAGVAGPGSRFSAAATGPSLPSTWPPGVDISSWQHPNGAGIDWRAVSRSGVRFAFVKATEGTGYTNPYFRGDRHNGWLAGLVVGAYHYARPAWPASTAVAQARFFVAKAGTSRGTLQLAPVLDLEATGGLTGSRLRTWALTFLRAVENLTGRAPALYTYPWFWTGVMGDTTAFAKYPLWFAIYNGERGPGRLPGGWRGWRFWQHTSSGSVPGIRGAVDLDVYCCTFRSFWAIADGRRSELWRRYATTAWLRRLLGPPRHEERPAGGGGRWQPFRSGLMFWSVDTGAREVHGAIGSKYLRLGGTTSLLGAPVSDETSAPGAGARQSVFRHGRIFWSRATQAHEVHGGILATYLKLGASGSGLGLPVSDEYAVPGGRQSAFQHGYLRWSASTRRVFVVGGSP